jgi:hypothetical protein
VALQTARQHTEFYASEGYPYLLGVNPDFNDLTVTNLTTGHSNGVVPLSVNGSRTRYGAAVFDRNRIFVADLSDSAVIVVGVDRYRLFQLQPSPRSC